LSSVESGEQLDIGEADRRGIVYAFLVLPCRIRAGYPSRDHGAEELLHEVLCTVSVGGLFSPPTITGIHQREEAVCNVEQGREDQGVKSDAIARVGEDENRFEDAYLVAVLGS